jgi:hypothetical protein
MQWVASPWFDLAEGSFPYPSTYIPLPCCMIHMPCQRGPLLDPQSIVRQSWRDLCWQHFQCHVHYSAWRGTRRQRRFDHTSGLGSTQNTISTGSLARFDKCNRLAYQCPRRHVNLVQYFPRCCLLQCRHVCSQPTIRQERIGNVSGNGETGVVYGRRRHKNLRYQNEDEGSCWPSLCCNEEMNLIITFAAARRSMAAIGAL